MTTLTCPAKLATLIERLDGLRERAPIESLREWLTALDIGLEDVRPYVRFGAVNYLRNLVRGGDWYHLLVICWRSGQRSPIHNHARSTCGLKVLTGVMTETRFDVSPCGLIKPMASEDYARGAVMATQDAEIHQVSNLQPAGTDLITLHIYSPPLVRMDTYSLTDSSVVEHRPVIMEHSQGSGI